MKVGILTFHRANNLGAVMQCYALQRYLTLCGHDVNIIDYHCKAVEMQYDILNPRVLWSRKNIFASLRVYLDRIRQCQSLREKGKGFDKFRQKYLRLTEPVVALHSKMDYDVLITGSDQVWNLHITNGVDRLYFLCGPLPERIKRVAYAVSAADKFDIFDDNLSEVLCCLNRFDSISVREVSLKDYLTSKLKRTIYSCVDPCFLIDREEYDKMTIPSNVSKPYILVYQMTYIEAANEAAEKIGRDYGYEVMYYYGGAAPNRKNSHTIVNPQDFLGKIAGASLVLTSSFHGIVFSIIYEKDFWTFEYSGNGRQLNLLSLLGLRDRMVSSSKQIVLDKHVDYSTVHKSLDDVVMASKQFLNDAL